MLNKTNTCQLKLNKILYFNTDKIPLHFDTALNCTTSTCIGISD